MDLALVSAAVIAFGVAMYVILDGFDLGTGILFPFAPSRRDRDTMINSIAPVWDGNETWLVLGGVVLLAGFPLAYSILLPAWYIPLMLFLFALVFRGVAFEFRPKAEHKWLWSLSFSAGSMLAAFAQGLVLGSFVQGLAIVDGAFVGGPFDWLTPFSFMVGVALVAGYALLGATWLILKTEGALQAWCYRAARPLVLALLAFIVMVSVWTPLVEEDIARRWFTWPNIAYLSPVPLITAVTAYALWRALHTRRELAPFLLSIALFMLSYFGLAVSLWPYIVPRTLTVWEAASPPETQIFLLVGVLLLLPVVLGYTIYTYRVFRGKVSAEHEAYH
jgi:cytochrome bd ubiquinol oxidase subunit II